MGLRSVKKRDSAKRISKEKHGGFAGLTDLAHLAKGAVRHALDFASRVPKGPPHFAPTMTQEEEDAAVDAEEAARAKELSRQQKQNVPQSRVQEQPRASTFPVKDAYWKQNDYWKWMWNDKKLSDQQLDDQTNYFAKINAERRAQHAHTGFLPSDNPKVVTGGGKSDSYKIVKHELRKVLHGEMPFKHITALYAHVKNGKTFHGHQFRGSSAEAKKLISTMKDILDANL